MSTFVSIGLPVYNGGEKLRRALDSLLAQTHTNFELIISDNASTDGITKEITEEYARRDSRIRLTRQPVNQGILANFLWVCTQARGEYFMWAAHDDAWSSNYVAALAQRLDESPEAILSTPTTCAERIGPNGTTIQNMVPAAPNGDRWETLDLFLKENICVWIYGLYRTAWIQRAAPELTQYALLLGGDRLWLYGLILEAPVVGDPSAMFYYTDASGKDKKDRTARGKIRFLGLQMYHMPRLCWNRLPKAERGKGLRRVVSYLYRHQISRHNPIGTLVRVLKLSILGMWFGLEAGVQRVWGMRRSSPQT